MEETFQIIVDLYEDTPPVMLDVIPGETSWRIILDGVELGVIETDGGHIWRWMDSGLSDEVAGRIGEKIEFHYS